MRSSAFGFSLLLGCSARPEPIQDPPPAEVVTPTKPSADPGSRLPATDGPGPTVDGPHLRVLGTAQDGGLPHASCSCERCSLARSRPEHARSVASLGVFAGDAAFLIDATPDINAQLHQVHESRGRPDGRIDRAPVDGILLTHAHVGHYVGLALLGFEAVHTRELPVWGTTRMNEFLRTNAPWDQLVRIENITLQPARPAEPIALAQGVSAVPVSVPHRDEYTDTVGYLVRGARNHVLYVPDTSPWTAWPVPLTEFLIDKEVTVALIDGTFYSGDELPGRDLSTLAHPLIVDSMQLLQPLVDAGKLEVHFTHLNHSNPAVDPGSPARKKIEERGFHVADDGLVVPL